MTILAFNLSDDIFSMLINGQLPTIVGIYIYEHDKFHAQLSWVYSREWMISATTLMPLAQTYAAVCVMSELNYHESPDYEKVPAL